MRMISDARHRVATICWCYSQIVLLLSDARYRAATGMSVIDIREVPNGVYGIRMTTPHGLYQTRFVVSR